MLEAKKPNKVFLDQEYKYECEHKIKYIKLAENQNDEILTIPTTAESDFPIKVRKIKEEHLSDPVIYRRISDGEAI